jgi:amino acid adenylation domain-containing protein
MANKDISRLTKEEIQTKYWALVQQSIHLIGYKQFIVTKNRSLNFAEANLHANIIQAAIQDLRMEPNLGVGLIISDHCQIIPAMIGVLKSRNYFIPMDINFPEANLKSMIENAEIKIILTVNQRAEQIRSLTRNHFPIISVDNLDFNHAIPDPSFDFSPDDIVQILFTSGSTGQPKGAIENYRYLTRSVIHKLSTQTSESNERLLELSTFTYSATHNQVFTSLLNGVTICYYDIKENGITSLPEWLRQQEITIFKSTPSVFRSLTRILAPDEKFPGVRTIQIGGEKRLPSDIEAIKKHFPNTEKFLMGFAATETQAISNSVFAINDVVNMKTYANGWPCDDLRVFIWDEGGNPLPEGEEGEIVVYGDSLARGYINNPKLTQERFIPDLNNPPWQYFKTGDLGKFLPDGQLLHLGRMDNMVKIKGVRIELDGIEQHILAYPGIIQVASKAVEDQKGNKKLASYFVAEKGIQIPLSDLRKHLASRLPLHLLPHYLIALDKIPLTSSGKVAISQLPLPTMSRPDLANNYLPPENDLEKKLVQIWEEEIGIEGIGVTDNFFEVGGDSLIGVLLFARIEEVLGRDLPVSVLLTSPTIRQQAVLLQNNQTLESFSPIIPINPTGNHSPLFFIPGKGGYPTRIRHLANKIDPQTPVYALQDLMADRSDRPAYSVESVASFYLNEIKKIVPQDPFILVGESLGGKIAYEMAQQLLNAGNQLQLLVILDTFNLQDSVNHLYYRRQNLSYFWMLAKKHLNILIHADWKGKLEYLRFYWDIAWQKIVKFPGMRMKGSERAEQFAMPENERNLQQSNLKASQAYKVKPYPGKVILFKALRGLRVNDPSNGWGQVILGELVIHPLDCYHGSILFEPVVSQLAAILQTYIQVEP